ncbi:Zinc ABC transporter, ATP-binding protein ZnuC [Clostridiaceae bacterium JG1575]|nr:Zinc ABC transporter, ATP-binding protein ZnuC [Clostridiaceae bacterium JG1575]
MEIRNLSFRYDPHAPNLFNGLSLTISRGMFLTVLGENGSAKSTLIRLMLGLLKPKGGAIKNSFQRIGYVPQKKEAFNMQFPITVEELLRLQLSRSPEAGPDLSELLAQVQLEGAQKKLFGDLSGGQQQRILIARAIAASPDLLILDEPLTGIDSHSKTLLHALLVRLNQEGLTIVSIEHDVAFALHQSSHILTLKEGEGVLYTAKDYRQKINHEDLDNLLYHEEEHGHAFL